MDNVKFRIGHIAAPAIVLAATLIGAVAQQPASPRSAQPVDLHSNPAIQNSSAVSPSQAKSIVAGPDTLVSLPGHLAPALQRAQDLGRVASNTQIEHVALLLKRSPAEESSAANAIDALQNPKSPTYHHWMTAKEYGSAYGMSDADVDQVATYLAGFGLHVEGLDEGRMTLHFSGAASQIEDAFHTEIHKYQVGSAVHISNSTEPQVPASISGLVAGVPLSDFMPHPLYTGAISVKRDPKTGKYVQVSAGKASPNFNISDNGLEYQLVSPQDFATIYNISPVWTQGNRGAGQTVAVVEDTLMKAADVSTFRQAFGLSGYAGTFAQEAPAGSHPCQSPGVTGNAPEAALDAEWAGSTAPDAAVVLAACADTQTQFGGLLATMNLLAASQPPQVISMSYGSCEAEMTPIEINQFESAYQQAAAEGVTMVVSTGDSGAAGCDDNAYYATHGIAASGYASTPYNLAVGGTDFYDVLQGTTANYWSTTNSSTYESALSYIPEKTWNNSCADSDLVAYEGFEAAYGASGLCNNYPGSSWLSTQSGSGAPSSTYAKPSWQVVYGNPADNLRDIPDVSLFASNGFYGHGLVFCDSDKYVGGVPCVYSNANDTVLNMAGGTSFAAPSMAGILALITQKYGRQGNVDASLYSLAATQYGTATPDSSIAQCDATLGNETGSSCIFHDVTHGSNSVPCLGTGCFGSNSETYIYGATSTSISEFEEAYPSSSGWDFATGLGSMNVANLFNAWAQLSPSSGGGQTGNSGSSGIGRPISPITRLPVRSVPIRVIPVDLSNAPAIF